MRVQCYVYDITGGFARAASRMLVGKQVDIVPHTGIVFGGKEYFFGGGICASSTPGYCIPLRPCETIELGNTTKTPEDLEGWLRNQHQAWNQDTYNLLNHNCNHFANEIAKFLGVSELPSRIVNIAEEALSTPQGAQIRQLIEAFDRKIQQQNSGGGLNPFGNVQNGQSGQAASEPVAKNQELEESLKEIAKQPTEIQRACLNTLITLAKNANEHRGEPKYQKVKMENPAFVKKVGDCPGGTEAMLAIGFIPDTHENVDYWVMQPDHHPMLSANVAEMNKLVAALPPAPTPAPVAPTAPATNSPFPGIQGAGMPAGMNPSALAGNPQMMAQAQQMMNNPQMMAQVQQMMQQNPQLMAQAQQLMNDPAAIQRLMQQFNQGGGRPPF